MRGNEKKIGVNEGKRGRKQYETMVKEKRREKRRGEEETTKGR